MRVGNRVWTAWQRLIDEGVEEPVVQLRFSPDGEVAASVSAIRESVREIVAAYRTRANESDEHDPIRPGEWQWLGVSDGVIVQVADSDAFPEIMRELAEVLDGRGVTGVFDVCDRPLLAPARERSLLLRCHLRPRGRRLGVSDAFSWEPDPDAHAAVLTAAADWCKQLGEHAAYSVTKGSLGPAAIGFAEDAVVRLREGIVDDATVRLVAEADETWREVGVGAVGRVRLAVARPGVGEGGWRPLLGDLTDMLRELADALAYGYVRPGSGFGVALSSDDLEYDWMARQPRAPTGAGFTQEAFEDVFAPDAFGVQLLGPGYAGRVPDAPSYRREPVGEASVLLKHVDPAAWFDAPFVPFGEPRSVAEPPPVLASAREELAPILYRPGALNAAGYADLPGL